MKSLKIGKSNEVVQLNIGGQIFRLVTEAPSTPATKNPVYQNRAERAWVKIYADKATAALKRGRTKVAAEYVTKANEQAKRLGLPLPFAPVSVEAPAPKAVKPAPVAPVVTIDAIEALRRDIAALRAAREGVQPAQTEKKVAHSARVLSRKDRKAIKKMKRHGRKVA